MKRIFTIFILIMYMFTSFGATIYYHQCGENQIISLDKEKSSHQSCQFCKKDHQEICGTPQPTDHQDCESKHCCKDVQIKLENSNEQISVAKILSDMSAFSPSEITIFWIMLNYPKCIDTFSEVSYPPDIELLTQQQDTYLRICNFRI